MCGIVGYVGFEQAAPLLLMGLKKLEYRGYDSAGIAVLNNNNIDLMKSKGRLQVLSDLTDDGKKLSGTIGIGHTRWATHGEPSDINSHPHKSDFGKFAVVHNGIIENYIEIKEKLINHGISFKSETDTETIAQLLEYYYNGDMIDTLIKVMQVVEGSYALGVICTDYPDTLFAIKKDSPLIVGIGENENFIASDIPAILSRTRDIYRLNDKEIAVLKKDNITILNTDKEKLNKEVFHVDWDIESAEKGGFEHFMFKEIVEQPKAIYDTVNPRLNGREIVLDDINFSDEYLNSVRKIFILACGSAYHVGVVAKYVLEQTTKIPVEVDLASEFRYRGPIVDNNTLVIVISQSGETADTLAAMREAKRLGARVLSIVNVVGSTIASESDDIIYTWAGPEIAVATTKAYSTQLAVVYLLALYISKKLKTISEESYNQYIDELLILPQKIEKILESKDNIQYLASMYFNCKSVFFIGRGLDYAMSLEGSLKLKEISYIHSEAYAAGELKHGTISLIEEGTLVVALATEDRLFNKMISNMKEVKARGAVVLAVTTDKHQDVAKAADYEFYIPDSLDIFLPSLAVIPLQLFSYYVASMKGCDIDKPRNLAKSVTVE